MLSPEYGPIRLPILPARLSADGHNPSSPNSLWLLSFAPGGRRVENNRKQVIAGRSLPLVEMTAVRPPESTSGDLDVILSDGRGSF